MSRSVSNYVFGSGTDFASSPDLPKQMRILRVDYGPYVGSGLAIWYEYDSMNCEYAPRRFHIVSEYGNVPDGMVYIGTGIKPLENTQGCYQVAHLYMEPQTETEQYGIAFTGATRMRQRGVVAGA